MLGGSGEQGEMMNERVLFVDDEVNILEAFKRQLRNTFEFDTATGSRAGLDAIATKGPYAVVVSDLRMPEMDGVEFLARVHEVSPDTVRIMLSGNADLDAAIAAVNTGNIFRFLTKPADRVMLIAAVNAAIQQYRLVVSERELLQKTLSGSVRVLIDILTLASPIAFARASRINRYVKQICKQLGVENTWQYELAALLSQIGCIALPAEILEKVHSGIDLTPEESRVFATHPATGHKLLANIPRLDSVAQMVARQNAAFDPFLTPKKAKDMDPIFLGGQMLRIALEHDAQVAKQTQRGTDSSDNVPFIGEISKGAGEPIGHQPQPRKPVILCIKDIQINMIVHQDIRTHKGILVVAKGQEVSAAVLELLHLWAESKEIVEPIEMMVPASLHLNLE
jgi:response regulator RpfG family c-di-GMP phosphodiesterase